MKGYTEAQIKESAMPLEFVTTDYNAALLLPDGRELLYWHLFAKADLYPKNVMTSVKLAKKAYEDVGGDALLAAMESLNPAEPLPKGGRYELADNGYKIPYIKESGY